MDVGSLLYFCLLFRKDAPPTDRWRLVEPFMQICYISLKLSLFCEQSRVVKPEGKRGGGGGRGPPCLSAKILCTENLTAQNCKIPYTQWTNVIYERETAID